MVRSQIGNVVNTASSLASTQGGNKSLMNQGPSGNPYPNSYSYNTLNRYPTNNWTGGGGVGGGGGVSGVGGGPGAGGGAYSVPPPPPPANDAAVSSYNQARNTTAFQWSKEGASQRTAGVCYEKNGIVEVIRFLCLFKFSPEKCALAWWYCRFYWWGVGLNTITIVIFLLPAINEQ